MNCSLTFHSITLPKIFISISKFMNKNQIRMKLKLGPTQSYRLITSKYLKIKIKYGTTLKE